ncbi:MAG: hypothetical protein ACJ8F0_04935 [Xanthobacteraceae bacterium]
MILIAGLQGSGKTTAAAKLANLLKGQGRRPLLAACDLRRPAAIRQLQLLGEQVGVPVHAETETQDAKLVAAGALAFAKSEGFTDLIVDTAGRMHVERIHARRIGRHSAEADETVRAHEHDSPIGHAGARGVQACAGAILNRHQPIPTAAEPVECSHLTERQQMMRGPRQSDAVRKARAWCWGVRR